MILRVIARRENQLHYSTVHSTQAHAQDADLYKLPRHSSHDWSHAIIAYKCFQWGAADMAIRHAIWKVSAKLERLTESALSNEQLAARFAANMSPHLLHVVKSQPQ
jgi:hypothetical protein